ncbi:MAG: hybrid sensor histidine kinase/response regulator [Armatimonadota bacterium]
MGSSTSPYRQFRMKWVSLQITVIYVLVGIVWVAISDYLLRIVFSAEKGVFTNLERYSLEGLFIILTSCLLYALISFHMAKIRRSEQALCMEKERLAVTLHSIGDGVITVDTAGQVVLINKEAESLTGWMESEATGKMLDEVYRTIDETTRVPRENPLAQVVGSGTVITASTHSLITSREGIERIIAESAAPIFDADSEIIGVVLVFRDITEQEKIQQALMNAQKLESVGILAGGIAHEFESLLGAITGNISLAKLYLNPDDPEYAKLTEAERASMRALNLTQQLLTFSEGGTLEKHLCRLDDIVTSAVRFAMLGSKARCELQLPAQIWPLEVDEKQIVQVVKSLVTHAEQSMPEGGVITLKAENTTVAAADALPLQPGKYVTLTVIDNGQGIPEGDLPKIFDPFYSGSSGSGLGLAIVHTIIAKHGGHIGVTSQLGAGTTFTIYLPAVVDAHATGKVVNSNTLVGKGNVLMLDREKIALSITVDMLTAMGYEVSVVQEVVTTVDAYRQARETLQPFDVVIMDLGIAHGDAAEEALSRLLEIDPAVKAIAASRNPDEPGMIDYAERGYRAAIEKPYQLYQLNEVIQQVIAGRSAVATVEQGG